MFFLLEAMNAFLFFSVQCMSVVCFFSLSSHVLSHSTMCARSSHFLCGLPSVRDDNCRIQSSDDFPGVRGLWWRDSVRKLHLVVDFFLLFLILFFLLLSCFWTAACDTVWGRLIKSLVRSLFRNLCFCFFCGELLFGNLLSNSTSLHICSSEVVFEAAFL